MPLSVLKPLAAFYKTPSPLEQFSTAAELATERCVDMKTAIPMVGDVPKDLPSTLTSKCTITHPDRRHDPKYAIRFYNDCGRPIGFIAADLRIKDGKIQLLDMRYGAEIKGFTPYAMRHFLSVLRDIKDITLSTAEMISQERLIPFTRIGFHLVDRDSGERISLSEIEERTVKPSCNAVLDLNDRQERAMAFSNLGLQPDAEQPRQNRVSAMATRAFKATLAIVRQ